MSSHNKILQIYNSRKYALELMSSLGYDTKEYEGFSINEVDAMMSTEQLDMLLTSVTEGNKPRGKTYIHYFLKGNLTDNSLRPVIEDLFQFSDTLTEGDCLLLVYDGEPSETFMKHLEHLYKRDNKFVVAMNIKRLQFNILNHSLVPKITVLTPDEKESLYQHYNVNHSSQMPEISRFDPQALAVCLRPGQVCKLIRKSPTSMTTEYYRLCV